MLPGQGKFGIIISRIPVMQSGLKAIVGEHLPDYELSFCRSQDELTLLQLRRAVLVIADLSGENRASKKYLRTLLLFNDSIQGYTLGLYGRQRLFSVSCSIINAS
ncbi:regulator [Klebsiella michiganensis]|uniref:Regulator n=1 Tax=Klebsiella michiganensis TaxID=1134687 RepID=A0A7H4N898_9ENTR|nr:regulator [Klebsiella michiganensis]